MRPLVGGFDPRNSNYVYSSMTQGGYGQGFSSSYGFCSFGNGYNNQFPGFPGFDNNFVSPNMSSPFLSGITLSASTQGGQGTVISNSYVSTLNYDSNGQPIRKEYSSQAFNKYGQNGTNISESRQQYRDSGKGIKKVSHQRTLNDQTHKITKTKDYKLKEENEDNYYMGIEESK